MIMTFSRRALMFASTMAAGLQAGSGRAAVINRGTTMKDVTKQLQAEIDTLSTRGGGVVSVPSGVNAITSLVLRNGVSLKGAGPNVSQLIAIGQTEAPAITICAGPVVRSGLQALTIRLGPNANSKVALKLVAQAALKGKPHGGLWNSTFADLEIVGFPCGLSLDGGSAAYMLPHQFITFERVLILGQGTDNAVKMRGQVNQIRFRDCLFDKVGDQLAILPLIDLGPCNDGANAPKLITFDQCTFQHAGVAILARSVQTLSVHNSWFENNGAAISVEDTIAVNIQACRFANSGSDGAVAWLGRDTATRISDCLFVGRRSLMPVIADRSALLDYESNKSIYGAGIQKGPPS